MAGSPPSAMQVIIASVLSIVFSLAIDVGLVKLGISQFPSTRNFSHFRFSDYGLFTVLGVGAACMSWPVVVRITSSPRWFFFRLAVVTTLVLWIPDLWIFLKHEPGSAVLVLAIMHLAIAIVTYNVLVHVAPVRRESRAVDLSRSTAFNVEHPVVMSMPEQKPMSSGLHRYAWITMMSGVILELVTGIATIMFVPFGRPNGWITKSGKEIYLSHAILGGPLALYAVLVLLRASRGSQVERFSSTVGMVGIALGAVGGIMTVEHSLRLAGMALMFLGSVIAFFAYLTPLIESPPEPAVEVRPFGDPPT